MPGMQFVSNLTLCGNVYLYSKDNIKQYIQTTQILYSKRCAYSVKGL